MKRAVLGIVVASTVAAACASAPSPHVHRERSPAPKASPQPSIDQARLDDLAILATGEAPSAEIVKREREVLAGSLALTDYIDGLVDNPLLGNRVIPKLIFHRGSEPTINLVLVLKSSAAPTGETVYYLHDACDPKKAERVHPWWALKTTVLVCPDSHRPDYLKNEKGWYCGGWNLSAEKNPQGHRQCGCGPNLINCARDRAHFGAVKRSLVGEIERTIGHVVNGDLPIDRAFTMNETVRDGTADTLLYERWQILMGAKKALSEDTPVDAPSRLAPRTDHAPGQHAGILTTGLPFAADSPRERMRDYFMYMWCAEPASVNVTADQILALGVTNLREGDGWRKLASMPVCTDCHARLDYGMQFFEGFPSIYVGALYNHQAQQKGTGPLYGQNIGDRLGEAPLSPRGFAELAVKQPAFARCMVDNVRKHVFNNSATSEDVAALRAAFDDGRSMKRVMRAALTRFAALPRERTSSSSAALADAKATLRRQLDTHCARCHADGPKGFLSKGAQGELPPELLLKMASQVATGAMPPKRPLEGNERKTLLTALIAGAFPSEPARTQALDYYRGALEPAPLRHGATLLSVIHARSGDKTPPPEMLVRGWSSLVNENEPLSPAEAASIASQALAACKRSGKTGAALQECVEGAVRYEGLVGRF